MPRAATHPASPPAEVTYEEYMAMPISNQHVEVVDGVIVVMPGATYKHNRIQARIQRGVEDFVSGRGLGLVLPCPSDVIIRKRPKLCVRQPDASYFGSTRAGFDADADPDRVQRANQDGRLGPDLVVEVLSPGQNEKTLADKLADYASIEVDEVWFADPETKTIRVLARDGDAYRHAGEFGIGDRLVSAVLPGLDLDVAAIFE